MSLTSHIIGFRWKATTSPPQIVQISLSSVVLAFAIGLPRNPNCFFHRCPWQEGTPILLALPTLKHRSVLESAAASPTNTQVECTNPTDPTGHSGISPLGPNQA